MDTQMSPRKAAAIFTSLVSWLFGSFCILLAFLALITPARQAEVGIIYVGWASVLGALAISKSELILSAYMMLAVAALNILLSSLNFTILRYSLLLAILVSIVSLIVLVLAIWSPLHLKGLTFPLNTAKQIQATRAIAATSLSTFVPLVSLVVPLTLNLVNRNGSGNPLLSWSEYRYALVFTAGAYAVAALVWLLWPPSALVDVSSLRPQLLLPAIGFPLSTAYFEYLFRKDWMAFALSQIAAIGILVFLKLALSTRSDPEDKQSWRMAQP
jgi:hypothetical protein